MLMTTHCSLRTSIKLFRSSRICKANAYLLHLSSSQVCDNIVKLFSAQSFMEQTGRKKCRLKLPTVTAGQPVPEEFKKALRKSSSVYLFHKNTAERIGKHLSGVLLKDEIILEMDAGIGMISRALLENDATNIVAFEPQAAFHPFLEELSHLYGTSFNYYPESLGKIIQDARDLFLNNLPGTAMSEEGCVIQIVGIVPSWRILVEISRRKRDEKDFFYGKTVNLYFCLPESSWLQFLDSKVQKTCLVERILFQVEFQWNILAWLKKKNFYFKSQLSKKGSDKMVLVQILTKKTRVDLAELQVFLTQFHNCTTRNKLVIPSLEHWAPTCGEELVKNGMPVFTRFSDLHPDELLDVFLYFRSLASYRSSGFFD